MSSTLFGWSMPPGCSMRDIDDCLEQAPELRHCRRCGSFLRQQPDTVKPFEDAIDCDGSETFRDCEYDEVSIQILGEEFRGKTYKVSTSPCGIDIGPHKPHREVFNAGVIGCHTCSRCGHVSEFVD